VIQVRRSIARDRDREPKASAGRIESSTYDRPATVGPPESQEPRRLIAECRAINSVFKRQERVTDPRLIGQGEVFIAANTH
jgi:hypothetical protein